MSNGNSPHKEIYLIAFAIMMSLTGCAPKDGEGKSETVFIFVPSDENDLQVSINSHLYSAKDFISSNEAVKLIGKYPKKSDVISVHLQSGLADSTFYVQLNSHDSIMFGRRGERNFFAITEATHYAWRID